MLICSAGLLADCPVSRMMFNTPQAQLSSVKVKCLDKSLRNWRKKCKGFEIDICRAPHTEGYQFKGEHWENEEKGAVDEKSSKWPENKEYSAIWRRKRGWRRVVRPILSVRSWLVEVPNRRRKRRRMHCAAALFRVRIPILASSSQLWLETCLPNW